MKILYVITRAARGGAQTHVLALVRAAARAGHEVTVMCGEDGWLGDQLVREGIVFVRAGGLSRSWNPLRPFLFVRALRRLIAAGHFDVVHFHSSNAMVGLLALPRGTRSGLYVGIGRGPRPRTIATIHGWSLLTPGWQVSKVAKSIYRRVMRSLLRHADRVILVSEADRALARKMGMATEQQMVVIHNGIPADMRFDARDAARAVLHAEGAAPVIGTIARLDYQKNIDALIDAARAVDGASFRIVGDGPEKDRLKARIKAESLADRVRILDDVPDPPRVLTGFDIFVLTSRYEGFPYTLLEAAAAGVPIVATDVGGVSEFVEDRVTGLLARSVDAQAIARALRDALARPDEAARRARQACERVAAEFSESGMTAETLSLYLK